jgi:hypothetical protein
LRGACFERLTISSLLIGGVARARLISSSRRLSLSLSRGVVMARSSDTGRMYASFMEEIKWRVQEIDRRIALVNEKQHEFDSIFEVEFCYLQLRFVCELIALASLVAHRSYGLSKELLEEWHADQIFYELEQINQHCFPWPVHVTRGTGGAKFHIADAPDRELTRTELKAIYGKCGDALHRGRLMHTLTGKQKVYDPNDIIIWVRSIAGLVREHSILLPQENRAMIVSLFGGVNQEVSVVQLAAEGPFLVQREAPQRPYRAMGKPRRPRRNR